MLPSRMATMYEGVIKARTKYNKHYRASVRCGGFSHMTKKKHRTYTSADEYGRAVVARLVRWNKLPKRIKLDIHKGYLR
jgi:hypothetical protein